MAKNLFRRGAKKQQAPLERKQASDDEFDQPVAGVMFNEGLLRGEAVAKITGGANLVDGKETWEYSGESKHDIEIMKRCCEAEIETMEKIGDWPAPFFFWRVAVLSSKEKNYQQEVDYLQTYVDILRRRYARKDMPLEHAVKKRVLSARVCDIYDRLPKAKARLAKQKEMT